MAKKIFEVITDILDQQVGGLYGLVEPDLEGADVKNIIVAAVHHAVADFTSATGKSFNGEEHRTSAFMGSLGSCIGWYNLFAHLSEKGQTSIQWNTQKRKGTVKVDGEDVTGADFGIAIAFENGNYNLAMFQAKNGVKKNGQEGFNLNRVPSGYATKPLKDGGSAVLTEAGRLADIHFDEWVTDRKVVTLDRKKNVAAEGDDKKKEKAVEHQIIKMAQQNEFAFTECGVARKGDESQENWTHYVIWLDEHENGCAPVIVSLDSVRKVLKTKLDSASEIEVSKFFGTSGILTDLAFVQYGEPDEVIGKSFADFLISGVDAGAAGWLQVNQEQIEILVKELAELGVTWSVAGRSGGGSAPSASPENWLPDIAPEPMSGKVAESAKNLTLEITVPSADNSFTIR